MKLSELKAHLEEVQSLHLVLPDGNSIPSHFHITEAGRLTKNFVDCGGNIREEKSLALQVWVANDVEHELAPLKLKKILQSYEQLFGAEDLDIEIEFQKETIGKYGFDFDGNHFFLTNKNTACLAQDTCGSKEKKKLPLSQLGSSCCSTGSC